MRVKMSLLATLLALSFSSNAVELKLKGKVSLDTSDGDYVEDTIEAQLKYDTVGQGYRLVAWLRARNSSVNPGMRLTLGDDTLSTQIGTHGAFYGFLAQDDISYSGLAILPQGVYTQKFVNGGFSYYNGISFNYNPLIGKQNLQFTLGLGKPYILDKDTWEESLLGDVDPWVNVNGTSYQNFRLSYDYRGLFQLLLVHDTIDLDVVKQWNWSLLDVYKARPDIGSSFLYLDPDYKLTINRIGLEVVLNHKASVIAEYARLTVQNDTYDLPSSNNFYVVGYYSLGSNYEITAGRSMGNPENSKANTDTFIGLHYCLNGLNMVFEYHKVVGDSWMYRPTDKGYINTILVGWSYGL